MKPTPFLLILCSALCACSSTPSKAPDFTTSLAAAYSLEDTLLVTGYSALQSGAISSGQAKRLLAVADQIKSALDSANSVYQGGQVALAQGQLQSATNQLSLVQSCSNAQSLGLTLDACLDQAGVFK